MKSQNNTDLLPLETDIEALANKHQNNPEAILEIFQEIQAERTGLAANAVSQVARALKVPAHHAYGVATFYSMLSVSERTENIIRVCNGPVCWLCGGNDTLQAFAENRDNHLDWTIETTSCLGLCDRAPAVLVGDEQAGPVLPGQVAQVSTGFRGHSTDYSKPRTGEKRIMLAKTGLIDPDSIESALANDAYCGLRNALTQTPLEVLSEVETSGLTGRGGAGFPVGRKWRFVAQATSTPKFIICNADESEPLIFKDRVLIDTNPHQILEGMAIAGYACGAQEAYIYIRGEYERQARRLEYAIHQAEEKGWLGENIQNSDFSFHIHVHRGAGAYICGEETALIESLEGKRGEPRTRPPYPPTAGFRGKPTLVNNVESYAAIPHIICKGGQWYRSISQYSTPGTKLFMILGHVNNPGLFEAPFGITLRQAIDQFGAGLRNGSEFHFALTGGAAGTFVPETLLDVPIDYASAASGVSLGAGAFLVCDQSVSPVALLRELLLFFSYESCGKCTPCRVGTHRAYEILQMLSAGLGEPGMVSELHALADNLQDASFCGLGQSVPIPIKSALEHFKTEFLAAETLV